MMVFFGKNNLHDYIFLKVLYKYHYAYWVAADVDHYVDSSINVSPYQYYKLIDQFNKGIKFLHDANKESQCLKGDHKKCLDALFSYVAISIKNFKFFDFNIKNNSELREILYLEVLDHEKDFHSVYSNYLADNSLEKAMIQGYTFMSDTIKDILLLDVRGDHKTNKEISSQIANKFMLAKDTIDFALNNIPKKNSILDEFKIISSQRNTDLVEDNINEIIDLNISFMKLWREFYLVHQHFYEDLFSEQSQLDQIDHVLFDHEAQKYSSEINITGIEITTKMLKYLKIEPFTVDIFSSKLLSEDLNYLIKAS